MRFVATVCLACDALRATLICDLVCIYVAHALCSHRLQKAAAEPMNQGPPNKRLRVESDAPLVDLAPPVRPTLYPPAGLTQSFSGFDSIGAGTSAAADAAEEDFLCGGVDEAPSQDDTGRSPQQGAAADPSTQFSQQEQQEQQEQQAHAQMPTQQAAVVAAAVAVAAQAAQAAQAELPLADRVQKWKGIMAQANTVMVCPAALANISSTLVMLHMSCNLQ